MKRRYPQLQRIIGYRFRNEIRLHWALTHPSFRYENEGVDEDNQRLEFLGDAALGLVTAAFLYERHPELREGQLTKLRSHVTSSKAFAKVAEDIGLGGYLLLGRGEQQSGGKGRASNLTDAFEAVVGAAYLDGGLRAVQKIFNKLIAPLLMNPPNVEEADNPKGLLQELAQRHWKVTPKYHVTKTSGPSHDRTYDVNVSLRGKVVGSGRGSNKRAAEMSAARTAWHTVQEMTSSDPPELKGQPDT